MDAIPRDRRASGYPSVTGIGGTGGGGGGGGDGRWSLERSTGHHRRRSSVAAAPTVIN